MMDPSFQIKANGDGSSARAEEADEPRLDGLHQRATPGVGMASSGFLRKTCPCSSSSYHISHQRGAYEPRYGFLDSFGSKKSLPGKRALPGSDFLLPNESKNPY